MNAREQLGSASEEMAGAELGDRRRTRRLVGVMKALEADPVRSFPRAMGSDAALEGLYRFLRNDGFSASDIVAPHLWTTLQRAAAVGEVLAVHDTTQVQFATAREDLGVTTGKGHYGLVVQAVLLSDLEGLPLGVAHLETLTRTGTKWRKRKREGQRTRVHSDDSGRESLRWVRGVQALEAAKQEDFEVIHVADAESDFFELIAALVGQSARFVIRAGQLDRQVGEGAQLRPLRQVLDEIPARARRTVLLSERKHPPRAPRSRRRRHPDRPARAATLAIGTRSIVLPQTRYCDVAAEAVKLHVVRVWEPTPPLGQPAVEWVLWTTEDTSSAAALKRIVDIYRKRWVIEEYFKALKSGCSLEKRQVESYDALCKVLALFVPIAHRLLWLRSFERANSQASAANAFSDIELQLMAQAPSNRALPPAKTITDALTHLARLGGHLRHNGRPGWQTLAWGYEKLLLMKLGWLIRDGLPGGTRKCDQ